MTVEEIREKLKTSEYDFLRNNKHLGSNIILLGLGGSYSYGMNIEGKSDIDIRGVALNSTELWSDCRRKYRYYDLQL